MYSNKEFVHRVGKKDYHYIRIHGQQNIKKRTNIVSNLTKQLHISQAEIKLASSEMKWKQTPRIMLICPHNHELINFLA